MKFKLSSKEQRQLIHEGYTFTKQKNWKESHNHIL